jgi:putative endonuclease
MQGGRRCTAYLGVTMEKFYYVYILQSETDPARFYVGRTEDLKERLIRHNRGEVPSTSKSKPWKIQASIDFDDLTKAVNFEKYLKSASGRAFAEKRF